MTVHTPGGSIGVTEQAQGSANLAQTRTGERHISMARDSCRHPGSSVSGHGDARSCGGRFDGNALDLRPGLVVYVPRGVVHSVKAATPSLQFVDFAQPPFDPAQIEWMQ
jgi:hypothetical protein